MLTWIDGDVYDVFMREFEISYEHLGQITTLPLVPGGEHISVTNENREEYVHAYINHYVHEHIRQEFTAFQRGFEKICSGEAIKVKEPTLTHPSPFGSSRTGHLSNCVFCVVRFVLAFATRGTGTAPLRQLGSGHARSRGELPVRRRL